MSIHEKEVEQEDAYTETGVIDNSIPTSLFFNNNPVY